MSISDIRKSRGVPCRRGGRVIYTGGETPVEGTIRSARHGYLMIQLDGQRWPKPFHPTWELQYLPKKARHFHSREIFVDFEWSRRLSLAMLQAVWRGGDKNKVLKGVTRALIAREKLEKAEVAK